MKRRDFLAAALLPLLAPAPLLAANKQKGGQTGAAKPAAKGSGTSAAQAAERRGKSAKKAGERTPPARKGKERAARRAAERPQPPPRAAAPNPPPPPPASEPLRNAISLPDEPAPRWRNYEITAQVTFEGSKGKLRAWLPLPLYRDTSWQRSIGHNWRGNFDHAGIYRDPVADMEVFYADWKEGVAAPHLQIVSQIAKQDRHFDITRRGIAAERGEVLRRCLQATALVPTDGLVRRTAEGAIGRIKDPVAQGKALYDWVVDNTTYDPLAGGIGRGDVEAMLDSGRLSGKSADIALLFVGLCRSMGIPARPVFGIRIDSSRLFAGLGATGNLRATQHCRAEFYTPGYGWIPVDPADVRKAIHDERLHAGDSKLAVLRKLLFGFWEMNWIGLNTGQDVRLHGANGGALPFLVQPQAEAAGVRFDTSDRARCNYVVTATRADL